MRIPKKIFYCWFGKTEKSHEILQYIETWKQLMPEYEIIEINETNFNVEKYDYAKTAYKAKKYAFVSDCARIEFLQQYGGIYFDTDVEMKKSLIPLLAEIQAKVLLSMEYFQFEITGVNTAVIISEENCSLWNDLLEVYRTKTFETISEPQTINMHINDLLLKNTSFKYTDKYQQLNYNNEEVVILQSKYLMKKTKEAYTIHHLVGTWKENLSFSRKTRRVIGILLKKIIGRSNFERLWNKQDK